ncbi:MAG: hypothetical protein HC893_00860 [Chloroflexaceae bacterium]|nr:hypothetical protein [Chloroflexaceae bacterium]NJL32656.1 hypothetical protein [Chloroflexaceae bacterium]NJO06487.1 hypothetical protein [Chloroflexaceae bacterium]
MHSFSQLFVIMLTFAFWLTVVYVGLWMINALFPRVQRNRSYPNTSGEQDQ